MSTMEQYAPLADDIELPVRLAPRTLLVAFRTFAFNNVAFRDGLLDEINIAVTSGERKPADVDEPPDYLQMRYEFSAKRERYVERLNDDEGDPTDETREYREVAFKLSAVAVRQAVPMPAYLAQEYYEIEDAEDAVEEGGLGRLEHGIEFSISTYDRTVYTSESYRYVDDSDNTVGYAATDSGPSRIHDDLIHYLDSVHRNLEMLDGEEREAVSLPELQSLEAHADLDSWATRAAQEDEYLRLAFKTFTLFKDGLRRQLGL